MKVGDLIAWTWQLKSDSWESHRFTGVVLEVEEITDSIDEFLYTILRVVDNTGMATTVRSDTTNLEVVSESR